MRLVQIGIANFRAIKRLDGLRVSELTSIVGKNDTGKSTVLLALQRFLEPPKSVAPQDFCQVGGGASDFWVQLTFSDLPAELGDQLMGESALDDEGQLTLRRVFEKSSGQNELLIVCDDYVEDDFRNLPGRPEKQLNDLIAAYAIPAVGKSGRGRTNQERWERLWEHAEGHGMRKQSGQLRRPSKETAQLINASLPSFQLIPSVQSLDTTAAPYQREFAPALEAALESLPEIDAIRQTGERAIREAVAEIEGILLGQTSQVKALEPDIDFAPQKAATVHLNVTDQFNVCNRLEDRGVGIQRLAVIAITKWRRQRASAGRPTEVEEQLSERDRPGVIYAIEEPEIFLHPAAQRDFFYDLRGLAEAAGPVRYQVVLTTHSTVFVDRMRPHEVAVLRRDYAGIAEVHQAEDPATGEDFERLVREELGFRNSDYFFANCLLLFEGSTEARALPQLARKLLGDPLDAKGIQPVNLEGKDKATVFLRAAKQIGVPAVALLDADAAKRRADLLKEGLIAAQDLLVYDDGDFEFQFDDGLIAEATNKQLPPPSVITAAGVAELRERCRAKSCKLKNELARAVNLSARHPLDQVSLGQALGDICPKAEIPGKIAEAITRAAQYAA